MTAAVLLLLLRRLGWPLAVKLVGGVDAVSLVLVVVVVVVAVVLSQVDLGRQQLVRLRADDERRALGNVVVVVVLAAETQRLVLAERLARRVVPGKTRGRSGLRRVVPPVRQSRARKAENRGRRKGGGGKAGEGEVQRRDEREKTDV